MNLKYLLVFACSFQLNGVPVLPSTLVANNLIYVYITAAVVGVLE